MPMRASNDLIRRFQRLDHTRRNMEQLFSQGLLSRHDIESVYEGLFIRSVIAFEEFLDKLFIGIMLQKYAYQRNSGSQVLPRVRIASPLVLREILLNGRDYLDWLPYGKTEERAGIYLRGGRPFSELSTHDKDILKRVLFLRNAIAHSSSHAQRRFVAIVINTTPVISRERTPAGFLRSTIRINPVTTRFEVYLSDLGRMARTLCQ